MVSSKESFDGYEFVRTDQDKDSNTTPHLSSD